MAAFVRQLRRVEGRKKGREAGIQLTRPSSLLAATESAALLSLRLYEVRPLPLCLVCLPLKAGEVDCRLSVG